MLNQELIERAARDHARYTGVTLEEARGHIMDLIMNALEDYEDYETTPVSMTAGRDGLKDELNPIDDPCPICHFYHKPGYSR